MSTTDNQTSRKRGAEKSLPSKQAFRCDALSAVVVSAFGLALFWAGAILDGLLGVALL